MSDNRERSTIVPKTSQKAETLSGLHVRVGDDCKRVLDRWGVCTVCFKGEDVKFIPLEEYDGPELPGDLMLHSITGRQVGTVAEVAPQVINRPSILVPA
jgi:hypothetical protein